MYLGAQTYTIRTYTQNECDFGRSMELIAKMGYKVVQISGIGAISAKKVREICDDNGLKIALTHTDKDKLLYQKEAVLEDHITMDCPYIGIGMMPDRYMTECWIDRFADDYGPSAEYFAKHGKKLMYHNHNNEWTKMSNGKRYIERLTEIMPSELMGITLDTYWVQAAGADPMEWIEKLQDRLDCVHLKDMSVNYREQRMAAIGDGNMPFDRIIPLLKKLGKTEYALVEQDNCNGEDPFDCLRRSYQNLKAIGLE